MCVGLGCRGGIVCCDRVYSVRVSSTGTDARDACWGCCLTSVSGAVSTPAAASAMVTRWQHPATDSTASGVHQSWCSTNRDRQIGKLSLLLFSSFLKDQLCIDLVFCFFVCLCLPLIYFIASCVHAASLLHVIKCRLHTDPGMSWKFMEFEVRIFQAWKVLESGPGHGKSWKMNSCGEKFWHFVCDLNTWSNFT